MNFLLALSAVVEGVTGVALLIAPTIVARLLLGAELSGAGVAVGRVAGIALLALGLACWPTSSGPGATTANFRAMLTYNLLVAVLLAYQGVQGLAGPLLWPAALVHAVITVLLGRYLFLERPIRNTKG